MKFSVSVMGCDIFIVSGDASSSIRQELNVSMDSYTPLGDTIKYRLCLPNN